MTELFKYSEPLSSKLQGVINISIIFNHIQKNEPISRIKLSKDLRISPSVVSRAIRKLIKDGYIQETEKLKTKSGKRPILLTVNEKKGFVAGIDLAKKRIKIIVRNLKGEIVTNYTGSRITDDKNIDKIIIKDLNHVLQGIDRLKAISVGVPANVDIRTGKISTPLYRSWENLNLKEILSKKFEVPVHIENAGNLSALGEKYFGRGKKFKDLVFIEISKGIGAGIIIDGHIFRGSYSSAGEIGYMFDGSANLGFKIEDKGFLEKHASLEGIKEQAIIRIKNNGKSELSKLAGENIEMIKPVQVCEAAAGGDKLAKDILNNIVNMLSNAIINIILILNPQIIVIGGIITALPEVNRLMIDPIAKKIKSSIPFKVYEIKLSKLGEDAGAIGASHHGLKSLLTSEFPYKL